MNWLIKLLLAVIAQCLTSILDMFADILNGVFDLMYKTQESLGFSNAFFTCRCIAFSLVSAFSIKQLIDMYVIENEEIDDDAFAIFTRVAECVATIECGSFIIEKLLYLAAEFYTNITASFLSKQEVSFISKLRNIVINVIAGKTVTSFILVIFLGAAIIIFVLVCIKAAKRGAELILFHMMLPFVALNKLGKNRDMWRAFTNELLIVIFGYTIQLLGYLGFAKAIALYGEDNVLDASNLQYLLAGLGWLIVTLNAPKWLEKFVSHSGAGQLAKGSFADVSRSYIQSRKGRF